MTTTTALPTGTHLVGVSYIGVTHYDARGAMFDDVATLEAWLRRANGGSGRSGSTAGAEPALCSCSRFAR